MTVSVVVPFHADGPEREAHWSWLRAEYERALPAWELLVVDPGTPDPGSWTKGHAVNDGLERAAGDVVVIADADCRPSWAALTWAADRAREAPWVVPFGDVYRLSAVATARLTAAPLGEDPWRLPHHELDRARPPYRGKPGGGIVVARAEVLDEVGGMDERFVGWGGEDFALAHALATCAGRPERSAAVLWHLWHPPQPAYDAGGHLPAANRALLRRYRTAANDPGRMRALIAERTGDLVGGCGCGGRRLEDGAGRAEARCVTCGLRFGNYEGQDSAMDHKRETGHVIEGLRGLRAQHRRDTVSERAEDPFVAAP